MSTPFAASSQSMQSSPRAPQAQFADSGEQGGQGGHACSTPPKLKTASRSPSSLSWAYETDVDDDAEREAELAVRSACELFDSFNRHSVKGVQVDIPEALGLAFEALKQADKSGQLALLRGTDSALPTRLAACIEQTLVKLAGLCGPPRFGVHSVRLTALDVKDIALWCYALSCAVGNQGHGLLQAERLRACKEKLRTLTTALLTRAGALDLPGEEREHGDVLAILSWISRGLKTRLSNQSGERESLLQADEPVRRVVEKALLVMRGWRSAQLAIEPQAQTPGGLDSVNLGKALVQISSALKILKLDQVAEAGKTWRQILPELALSLLQDGRSLQHFTQWTVDRTQQRSSLSIAPLNGVTVANVTNLVKNFIDAKLFDLKCAPVQALAAAVCKWMAQLDPGDLQTGGGQTLSNCANFLRTITEAGLQDPKLVLNEVEAWGQACKHVMEVLARLPAPHTALDAQALANLASFVKAMGKLEQSDSTLPKPALKLLRQCVHKLYQGLSGFAAGKSEAESLSSLCSALAYFLRRNLGPRAGLLAFVEQHFQGLDEATLKSWPAKSREQMLRTAVELWESSPAAAAAALCLLPGWSRAQEKQIYLKAADKLLVQDAQRIAVLQTTLLKLLPMKGRPVTHADVTLALGQYREEAPVPALPDAPHQEPEPQAQDLPAPLATARPERLAQMQKLLPAPPVLTTTMMASTTVTTATSSTTVTTQSTWVTPAPKWIKPTSSAPQLHALPVPAQTLRAQAALAALAVAQAKPALQQDREEDEADTPLESRQTDQPALAAAPTRRKKKKKNATIGAVDGPINDQTRLLARLANCERPGEVALTPVCYQGRTEPALYWAIRFGRPDLVALRLSRLPWLDQQAEQPYVDFLKKILAEEVQVDFMQERALNALLSCLSLAPESIPLQLTRKILSVLRTAALPWQRAFLKPKMATLAVLFPSDPGTAVQKKWREVLMSGDPKKLNDLFKKSRILGKHMLLPVEPGLNNTPLMLAVYKDEAMVRLCLAGGAPIKQLEAHNAAGYSALTLATARDRTDAVKVLLEAAGTAPDVKEKLLCSGGQDQGNLLCLAAAHSPDCLALLLDSIREGTLLPRLLLQPNSYGAHPLAMAASAGKSPSISLLLNAGKQNEQLDQLTDWGTDALMCACEGDHEEAVKSLLDWGRRQKRLDMMLAREALAGDNALLLAAKFGNSDVFKLVLQAMPVGAKGLSQRNSQGESVLTIIAAHGDGESLLCLLSRLSRENLLPQALLQANAQGQSAVELAAMRGAVDLLDLLLGEGCLQEQIAALNNCEQSKRGIQESENKALLLQVLELHANACLDDTPAQYQLGKLRLTEPELKFSLVAASKTLLLAAQKDHAGACFELGELLLGDSPLRDSVRGQHWLRKAAELGWAQAHHRLGLFWLQNKEPFKAQISFRKGAELFHPLSQIELGKCYELGRGVAAPDQKLAVEWYGKAAKQGYAQGQYLKGMSLLLGTGAARDEAAGMVWIKKAVDQNHPAALTEYGASKLTGRYQIKVDVAEALSLFERAADGGDAAAFYYLGHCRQRGTGTPGNKLTAADYFRQGADKGNPECLYQYAMCLHDGDGDVADHPRAVQMLEQAAEAGLVKAMYACGRAYLRGEGVAPAPARGEPWLRKAAAWGHQDALALVQDIDSKRKKV